ncbi:hypothetical protein KEC34_003603, partial [Escherichia coli]|nr:hypothetical protein [Escherichia coli]
VKELNDVFRTAFMKLMFLCLAVILINMFTFKNQTFNLYMSKGFFLFASLMLSVPLFHAAKELFPHVLKIVKIKSWRMAINIRRYYKLTVVNNFLLHIGAIGIFATTIFLMVFGMEISSLTYFTMFVLSISFLWDVYNRVRFITSRIWKGILGKVVIILCTGVSFIISNFLMRHWIACTTGLEPKFFGEFINMFSVFFAPVAYLIFTLMLCIIIIMPEIIGLLLLMLFNPLREGFIKRKFPSLVELSVRIQTGKRTKHLTNLELALIKSKIMIFRILAAPMFLASIGYLVVQINNISSDFFDGKGRLLLVNYYYDLENVNQKSTMRYYKVDNSKTSVAVLVDGKWQFFSLDI